LWFDAEPPPYNGMSIGKTRLRIFGHGEHVGVCERPELMRYPQSCLERHITPSGAFCLGLELRRIVTMDDAADWWSDLHHFLVLQTIAEETGRWAAQHALSHGQKAAEHEIRARHLASKLDIEDDYNRAVDGEANWLARAVDGEAIPDAPKNKTMRELLRLERARRNAVEGVWRYQFAQGAKCCGTMKDCRLRDLEGAASAASRAA
jgi:hypothetical protein